MPDIVAGGTTTTPLGTLPDGIWLHIGGAARVPPWTVLDVNPAPHVDIVADCSDLGALAAGSCAVIYASHVVEHLGYDKALPRAMNEFFRVLAPGGQIMLSVPDLATLCRMFVDPALSPTDRFWVMRMMFGGREDPYDVHLVGLNDELLAYFLRGAGFVDIGRVPSLGIFNDTSALVFAGRAISLNMVARKPP